MGSSPLPISILRKLPKQAEGSTDANSEKLQIGNGMLINSASNPSLRIERFGDVECAQRSIVNCRARDAPAQVCDRRENWGRGATSSSKKFFEEVLRPGSPATESSSPTKKI